MAVVKAWLKQVFGDNPFFICLGISTIITPFHFSAAEL